MTIESLKWPQDKSFISRLNLEEKQYWFAVQDARTMIFLADTEEFKQYWFWHYLIPLKIKRFLYRFKFW